jgi:hypothetical protein
MKAYASGNRKVNGIHFEGAISFNNGPYEKVAEQRIANVEIAAGCCDNEVDDDEVVDSVLFHLPGTAGDNLLLGYTDLGVKRVEARGNFIVGGYLTVQGILQGVVTDNTFFSDAMGATVVRRFPNATTTQAYTWDHNHYLSPTDPSSPSHFAFCIEGTANCDGNLSWDAWRAQTGWDSASQFDQAASPPDKIFVRKNDWEPGRANIAIVNASLASEVHLQGVDLASIGLSAGDSYELHNAQDYFGDLRTGTYDGQSIAVQMTGTVAKPQGFSRAAISTMPYFGAFVLRSKLAASNPEPSTGDAAPDSPLDASLDVSHDSSVDATTDTRLEATPDSKLDAATEAGAASESMPGPSEDSGCGCRLQTTHPQRLPLVELLACVSLFLRIFRRTERL